MQPDFEEVTAGQPAELEEYAEYLSTVVTTAALPFWYATVQKDRGGYDIVPGVLNICNAADLWVC